MYVVIIPREFSKVREPLSFVLENRRDTKSKPSLTEGFLSVKGRA